MPSSSSTTSKPKAKTQRVNFSQAEDILIETAYEAHKVKSQQKKNKAAEERVRKRTASKIMNTSLSSVDSAPKTDIGEEYNSASGSASDVEQEDASASTDHEEMFEKEHARRRRYLPARENVASRSELDSFMRNAGSSERDDEKFCDQGKKRGGTKNRGKRQVYDNISLVISKKNYILSDIVFDIIETSVRKIRIHLDRLPTYTGLYHSKKKKIEDALPDLLSSVKEAAEAHTKALKKWESTFRDSD
ncbi:hypothetical protein QZH41_019905 [Actinostola sp. cb2023]|nr:hypothetical protein QZH41_019905 [Actinostola sp. cb2023]